MDERKDTWTDPQVIQAEQVQIDYYVAVKFETQNQFTASLSIYL